MIASEQTNITYENKTENKTDSERVFVGDLVQSDIFRSDGRTQGYTDCWDRKNRMKVSKN